MSQIEIDSGIPLYIQLKDILKDKILKGEYKPQERIPPENELCVLYGVSRITVRQALSVLAQERLLFRKQGKGTFVTSPMFGRQLPKLDSVSETMRELGLVPSSRVVERRVENAQADVAALLKLPAKQQRVNKIVGRASRTENPRFSNAPTSPISSAPPSSRTTRGPHPDSGQRLSTIT